jgi:hypothetical protein
MTDAVLLSVAVAVVLLVAFEAAAALIRRRSASRGSAHDTAIGITGSAHPVDENVQFTVYRPREVTPRKWYALLAFAHLTERRPDEPDATDPMVEVQQQAERLLDREASRYLHVTVDGRQAIPRSGELTLVPHMDGIEFNPERHSFRWELAVHRAEFQFRTISDAVPQTARGHLAVFWGAVVVADVPLTLRIVGTAADVPATVTEHARPYRHIFASYSHRDGAVVQQFEDFMESLGDTYLRDVHDVRAGEVWTERLEELIRQADVFQLFWSWNALASPFVRKEWEFALALQRPHFVRPVYWEEPLPAQADLPPDALRRLHFHRLGSTPVRVPASAGRWTSFPIRAAAAAVLVALLGWPFWNYRTMTPSDGGGITPGIEAPPPAEVPAQPIPPPTPSPAPQVSPPPILIPDVIQKAPDPPTGARDLADRYDRATRALEDRAFANAIAILEQLERDEPGYRDVPALLDRAREGLASAPK